MAKKRTDPTRSREWIANAALGLVRRRGASGVTVGDVAEAAGCAKGLVHYHFKTKKGLWEAVANQLADEREAKWQDAFRAPTPRDAIRKSWDLLVTESADGTMLAWTSMFGPGAILPEQTVSERITGFCARLGSAAQGMLQQLGMHATIPASEIGWLLGTVVTGVGFQLLGGADQDELEGAYAAAWLGILSLTDAAA
jgi:AcrR family transcriptional regulator